MRIVLVWLIIVASAFSQVVEWVNGPDDPFWSDSNNWNVGVVPGANSDVLINVQAPFVNGSSIIAVDDLVTIHSLTFGSDLTAVLHLKQFSSGNLTLKGNITNHDALRHEIDTAFYAGSDATWSGQLKFGSYLGVETYKITLTDDIVVSGTNLNFKISSASSYGKFLGSGTATVTGVTIGIDGGSYAFKLGDTFDFTSGNFSGAILGSLPTLSSGLAWDKSNFLTTGQLTVVSAVPEPSDGWMVIAFVGIMLAVSRSRRGASKESR